MTVFKEMRQWFFRDFMSRILRLIGHFQVALNLIIKTRLSAKFFKCKLVLCILMKTTLYNKNFEIKPRSQQVGNGPLYVSLTQFVLSRSFRQALQCLFTKNIFCKLVPRVLSLPPSRMERGPWERGCIFCR